jgi:hypothetical protein
MIIGTHTKQQRGGGGGGGGSLINAGRGAHLYKNNSTKTFLCASYEDRAFCFIHEHIERGRGAAPTILTLLFIIFSLFHLE